MMSRLMHTCTPHHSSARTDRLFTEFVGSSSMLASATLGREWLSQMDTAAQEAGLVIQYVHARLRLV